MIKTTIPKKTALSCTRRKSLKETIYLRKRNAKEKYGGCHKSNLNNIQSVKRISRQIYKCMFKVFRFSTIGSMYILCF